MERPHYLREDERGNECHGDQDAADEDLPLGVGRPGGLAPARRGSLMKSAWSTSPLGAGIPAGCRCAGDAASLDVSSCGVRRL